jgi:hypothetical protein
MAKKSTPEPVDDRRVPDPALPADPPPTAHRSTGDQIREMEGEGQAQEPSAADPEPESGTGPDGVDDDE